MILGEHRVTGSGYVEERLGYKKEQKQMKIMSRYP